MKLARYAARSIDPLDELPELNGQIAITNNTHGTVDYITAKQENSAVQSRIKPTTAPKQPLNPVLRTVPSELKEAFTVDNFKSLNFEYQARRRKPGKLVSAREFAIQQEQRLKREKANE